MMATESRTAALHDLKTRIGGIATAFVSRNGLVLSADLPEAVYAETFAVMCDAIFGAATTADGELNHSGPERIMIEGCDSKSVIVRSGDDALLVALVNASEDYGKVLSETTKFATLR